MSYQKEAVERYQSRVRATKTFDDVKGIYDIRDLKKNEYLFWASGKSFFGDRISRAGLFDGDHKESSESLGGKR